MTSSSYQVYVLRMRKMNNDNRPKWTFSISSAETTTTHNLKSLNELTQYFVQMMAMQDGEAVADSAALEGDQTC